MTTPPRAPPVRWARPARRVALEDGRRRLDVAVYEEGRGPPALLVPVAWGLSAPLLLDALGPARKFVTLVSFDPPGVGASGPAPGDPRALTTAAVARHAALVLDALDLTDVTLLGVSNGGLAAQMMLAAGAPRVARAALVSAFAHGRIPSAELADAEDARKTLAFTDAWRRVAKGGGVDAAREALDALPGAFATQDGGAELVLGELVKRERAEAVATRLPVVAHEVRDADVRDGLTSVATPTWVVSGAEDGVVPAAMGEEVARLLPDAAYSRYEGASHFPFFEKPAVFHRHFREFAHGRGPPASAVRGR